MPQVSVNLTITKAQMLKYYQGVAGNVTATSCDGSIIRFPANILRPFVDNNGVNGRFIIEFDDCGKLKNIFRI